MIKNPTITVSPNATRKELAKDEHLALIRTNFPQIWPRVLNEDTIFQQTLNLKRDYASKIGELESLRFATVDSLADFSDYEDESGDIDLTFETIAGIDNEILFYTSKLNRLERDSFTAELAALDRRIEVEQEAVNQLQREIELKAVDDEKVAQMLSSTSFSDAARAGIFKLQADYRNVLINLSVADGFLDLLKQSRQKLESAYYG